MESWSILEGLGLVGDFETFIELGDVEGIMELRQLQGKF
jgi:hypothetical protein